MKTNQEGFGAVEGILIIVIAGLLSFTGWYVWQSNKKVSDNLTGSNSSAKINHKGKFSKQASNLASKTSKITDGPGKDWKTYTNYVNNFSVVIPKSILVDNGNPCTQDNTVHDNYGNIIPGAKTSFRPAKGITSTTVVEDGVHFYVTQAYGYQLGGESSDGSHGYFSSCVKTDTTPAIVKQYLANSVAASLDLITIAVISTPTDQAMINAVRTTFNDNALVITAKTKNTSGNWEDLQLGCGQEMCNSLIGGKFYIRYYPQQKKVVYIGLGNAGHLYNAAGDTAYGQQVADSFKFLE